MTASKTASIHVFTYKDGLLARLAHDLRLSLRRFEIEREGEELRARFWPGSLVVDGVADRQGEVDTQALSESDRRKIVGNIAEAVLRTGQFAEAEFRGRLVEQERAIDGELTLLGKTLPQRVTLRGEGERRIGETTLVPSRWGIAPYRALAGAIKLQDRVLVRALLPIGDDVQRWTAG